MSSIPIPKIYKPPPDLMLYRPISLLSSVNTILEKIMQERLANFIVESNTLPAQQIGFRIKHNICQTLLEIRILVKNSCGHSISTWMVLLDIKAAFGTVWHDGFIYKLNIFVFPLPIIKMIEFFTRTIVQSLHWKKVHRSSHSPQRSCLSPFLYNLLTSDSLLCIITILKFWHKFQQGGDW